MQIVFILDILSVGIVALGVAYVITGSKIGFLVRMPARKLLRWCGLDALAFCPACNAWWGGAVISLVGGFGPLEVIQLAFSSSVIAAVAQARWGLAAEDESTVDETWSRVLQRKEAKDGSEERSPRTGRS